jgi:hypothetical protein
VNAAPILPGWRGWYVAWELHKVAVPHVFIAGTVRRAREGASKIADHVKAV